MKKGHLNSLGRKKRPKIHDDLIVFRAGNNLKERFLKYCKDKGESTGTVLRPIIKRILRNAGL